MEPGIQHLGIQAGNPEELQEVYGRLRAAGRPVLEEGATTCCYARSEKSWTADPQGVAWETFLTSGASTVYGGDPQPGPFAAETACCTGDTPQGACCPPKPALPADAPCCGAPPAAA